MLFTAAVLILTFEKDISLMVLYDFVIVGGRGLIISLKLLFFFAIVHLYLCLAAIVGVGGM